MADFTPPLRTEWLKTNLTMVYHKDTVMGFELVTDSDGNTINPFTEYLPTTGYLNISGFEEVAYTYSCLVATASDATDRYPLVENPGLNYSAGTTTPTLYVDVVRTQLLNTYLTQPLQSNSQFVYVGDTAGFPYEFVALIGFDLLRLQVYNRTTFQIIYPVDGLAGNPPTFNTTAIPVNQYIGQEVQRTGSSSSIIHWWNIGTPVYIYSYAPAFPPFTFSGNTKATSTADPSTWLAKRTVSYDISYGEDDRYKKRLFNYVPDVYFKYDNTNDWTKLLNSTTDFLKLVRKDTDVGVDFDYRKAKNAWLPYLLRDLGWDAKTISPDLWRWQARHAITLFKEKGLVRDLSSMFKMFGVDFSYQEMWRDQTGVLVPETPETINIDENSRSFSPFINPDYFGTCNVDVYKPFNTIFDPRKYFTYNQFVFPADPYIYRDKFGRNFNIVQNTNNTITFDNSLPLYESGGTTSTLLKFSLADWGDKSWYDSNWGSPYNLSLKLVSDPYNQMMTIWGPALPSDQLEWITNQFSTANTGLLANITVAERIELSDGTKYEYPITYENQIITRSNVVPSIPNPGLIAQLDEFDASDPNYPFVSGTNIKRFYVYELVTNDSLTPQVINMSPFSDTWHDVFANAVNVNVTVPAGLYGRIKLTLPVLKTPQVYSTVNIYVADASTSPPTTWYLLQSILVDSSYSSTIVYDEITNLTSLSTSIPHSTLFDPDEWFYYVQYMSTTSISTPTRGGPTYVAGPLYGRGYLKNENGTYKVICPAFDTWVNSEWSFGSSVQVSDMAWNQTPFSPIVSSGCQSRNFPNNYPLNDISDINGFYSIANLKRDRYILNPYKFRGQYLNWITVGDNTTFNVEDSSKYITISGNVYNTSSGGKVPYANVLVSARYFQTITDSTGAFSIQVPIYIIEQDLWPNTTTTSLDGYVLQAMDTANPTTIFSDVLVGIKAPIASITPGTTTTITTKPIGAGSYVSHSFNVGDTVAFKNLTGMIELNGMLGTVTQVINDYMFTVGIDSSTFSSFSASSTGTVYRYSDVTGINIVSAEVAPPTGSGTGTLNIVVANGGGIDIQGFEITVQPHGSGSMVLYRGFTNASGDVSFVVPTRGFSNGNPTRTYDIFIRPYNTSTSTYYSFDVYSYTNVSVPLSSTTTLTFTNTAKDSSLFTLSGNVYVNTAIAPLIPVALSYELIVTDTAGVGSQISLSQMKEGPIQWALLAGIQTNVMPTTMTYPFTTLGVSLQLTSGSDRSFGSPVLYTPFIYPNWAPDKYTDSIFFTPGELYVLKNTQAETACVVEGAYRYLYTDANNYSTYVNEEMQTVSNLFQTITTEPNTYYTPMYYITMKYDDAGNPLYYMIQSMDNSQPPNYVEVYKKAINPLILYGDYIASNCAENSFVSVGGPFYSGISHNGGNTITLDSAFLNGVNEQTYGAIGFSVPTDGDYVIYHQSETESRVWSGQEGGTGRKPLFSDMYFNFFKIISPKPYEVFNYTETNTNKLNIILTIPNQAAGVNVRMFIGSTELAITPVYTGPTINIDLNSPEAITLNLTGTNDIIYQYQIVPAEYNLGIGTHRLSVSMESTSEESSSQIYTQTIDFILS